MKSLISSLDSDYFDRPPEEVRALPERVDLPRVIPFAILHLGCLGVFFTGWSWFAVGAAFLLYVVRMFFVTGIYHRYFCHKSYSTSRPFQFILALCGLTAVQRGPLWWAAVHRHHHQHSDDEHDIHSPSMKGFWWSHIGWMTSTRNFPTDYSRVKDFAKFPELRFLNRFDILVPILFAASLIGLGEFLRVHAPGLGTNGMQLLVWGFFVSTCILFHCTSFINSLAHIIGRRRYDTGDDSRNSFILAILTLGEGWHNNHHKYQVSARQGFFWWELDITYYVLKMLSWTGLIWGLRSVPASAYKIQTENSASTEEELGSMAQHADPASTP